jgi:Tol biopolymer transport system component
MLLIGGGVAPALIYDVSDPLHPYLLCSLQNTVAHLFTGDTFAYLRPAGASQTQVVLRSIGSGNESVVTALPFQSPSIWWTPQGGLAAYTVFSSQPDANHPAGTTQVWVFSQGKSQLLFAYGNGIGDCICRYGLPPPVLAISPDGQYLVAGRLAGKGSDPMAVYRISDHARVLTADQNVENAIWDRSGHKLYLIGFPAAGMHAWTPEAGVTSMGGPEWSRLASLSPDGSTAVFTSFTDANAQIGLHVSAYDIKSGTTTLLSTSPRSQVLFVRDGWVWYLEEQACTDCLGGSQPTGRVFAKQMPSGPEQVVSFSVGDDPIGEGGTFGALTLESPEFWPAA